MRTPLRLIPALIALIASGQAGAFGRPRIAFVTDLADVAGCRFLGTVRAPVSPPGFRIPDDFQNYYHEALETDALMRGATHIYILNRSARWGGAAAFGTAYLCR